MAMDNVSQNRQVDVITAAKIRKANATQKEWLGRAYRDDNPLKGTGKLRIGPTGTRIGYLPMGRLGINEVISLAASEGISPGVLAQAIKIVDPRRNVRVRDQMEELHTLLEKAKPDYNLEDVRRLRGTANAYSIFQGRDNKLAINRTLYPMGFEDPKLTAGVWQNVAGKAEQVGDVGYQLQDAHPGGDRRFKSTGKNLMVDTTYASNRGLRLLGGGQSHLSNVFGAKQMLGVLRQLRDRHSAVGVESDSRAGRAREHQAMLRESPFGAPDADVPAPKSMGKQPKFSLKNRPKGGLLGAIALLLGGGVALRELMEDDAD